MADNKKDILVYADWHELGRPGLMGNLSVTTARGHESFSFEYSDSWLKSGFTHVIDPDLQLYAGAYIRVTPSQISVFS